MKGIPGPPTMPDLEAIVRDERWDAAIEWWTNHNSLRRGTKRRQKSREQAIRRFGERFIDGFEHGIQHALVLVPMGDDFNAGYYVGLEIRWKQKREKQKRNRHVW